MQAPLNKTVITLCFHCGDECRNSLFFDGKSFCCDGCRLVYEILNENNLCNYYSLNDAPGITQKKLFHNQQFAFLDDIRVKQKLISFTNGKITSLTFYIPQMHCSSCIWLLENLSRINAGVIRSQVNFLRREASVTYYEDHLSLRRIVELLASLGYEPVINLDDLENKGRKVKNRTAIYKIGVAGFCFGNIMLFSFPEYFSSGHYTETGFKGVFSYLNFTLSLPVFFYCSSQFFRSALNSLKQKFLNIDVPIGLGILVMFVRSSYEIFSQTGAGYMDTMTGLVFFMLVGRAFQNKTYDTISFERDYKSFFPVSILVRKNDMETSVPVSDLNAGDRIIIRNEELIPCDAVLMKGDASIDYSFVTGESLPVIKKKGDLIYAGGKQRGTVIELETVKNVSQSYLTQLWNSNAYAGKKDESKFQQLINHISHYFTIVLLVIAGSTLAGWFFRDDLHTGINAFTAVLIIACPCALAISSPFTMGSIVRVFGRKKFYVKNHLVVEKLAKANTIVFDKTGTLTETDLSEVLFTGDPLNSDERKMVKSLVYHSSHPLSKAIYDSLKDSEVAEVKNFSESNGEGISGEIFYVRVKIGSANFVGAPAGSEKNGSYVYVSIDGTLRGFFSLKNVYRKGLENVINSLKKAGYRMSVLSGDHEGERKTLEEIFGKETDIRFNQSPSDKLRHVQYLQRQKHNVLMIGDGLNDAGALKQSNVGISVSGDVNNFSPACDGILSAASFNNLPTILKTGKSSRKIILASFGIALLYNTIGLWFACSGNLSPVVAAILMPVSAVTIITFTTGVSNWIALR